MSSANTCRYSHTAVFMACLASLALAPPAHAQQDPADQAPAQQTEDVSNLPDVTVTAQPLSVGERASALPEAYAGGQVSRGSRLGLMGNVDFMDAPVSASSYTAETIANQAPRTVGELLGRNDASVRVAGGEGNSFEQMQIRGFGVDGGSDLLLNGLPGLVAQYRSATDFVERVEVQRGPSAMTGGMSPSGSIGGSVNLVTKRAGDAPLTRLNTMYLSSSRLGLHADVGRRFGENAQWGLRLNGLLRGGDTQRHGQRDNAFIGAAALDYRGERLRASLDLIRQDARQRGARTHIYGIASPGITTVPEAPSGRTNFDQPWARLDSLSNTVMGRIEYDINPNLTAWLAAGRSSSTYEGAPGGNAFFLNGQGDYRFQMAYMTFRQKISAVDAGLRGSFDTAGIKHRWAFNVSHLEGELGRAIGGGVPGNFGGNVHNPIVHPEPPRQDTSYPVPRTSTFRQPSLALIDTMSFADDRVLLTLGVRSQGVKSTNYTPAGTQASAYDKSAITPFVGLVVKPWRQVSLYANRSEGLSRGSAAPDAALNAGEVFPPFKSRQTEIGVKFDMGQLGGHVALFQLERPNAGLGPDKYYRVNGKQRNRGLELGLFGDVAPGLRLLGSATLLDARLTRTATGANQGKRAMGVPRFAANLGVEWDLPAVPGLTLASHLVHTGKAWADQANTLRVPGWQRVDLGLRYGTKVASRPLLLRAGVENAFNKSYWQVDNSGGLALSMPRTFRLTASVDF